MEWGRRLTLEHRVDEADPRRLIDLLAQHTDLSRSALKQAMIKGAVWLQRSRGGRLRVRRATTELRPGDRVSLFYDQQLLAARAPQASCLLDRGAYSVWLKPAGLLAQGSNFGDHCSLARQVEQQRGGQARVYLVHRLDRETVGLMLVAHSPAAAARLSALLREGKITKRYRALVLGDLAADLGPSGVLASPVAGKPSRTEFRVIGAEGAEETGPLATELDLVLETGRTHQIRRQLADAGHPVLGDPRYGRGNKNRTGLSLAAYALEWACPLSGEELRVALDPRELLGLSSDR